MDQKLINSLEQELYSLFKNVYEDGGGYGFRYQHSLRVMRYCQKIASYPRFQNHNINLNALLIGGLFHDIGKIIAVDEKGHLIYGNYGGISHDQAGAEIAPKYLKKYISDKKLIDLICLIISEQENKKETTTIESQIVKDADRLDHYGVLHLWCSVTYANYHQKNIEGLKEFWEGEEGLSLCQKCLSEFFFSEVKAIAEKRLQHLKQATDFMFNEQEGKDL